MEPLRPDQQAEAALTLAEAFSNDPLFERMLRVGMWRADEAGVACYLETATDANIAFYGKGGFEVIGQADCYGHTLTGMVRRPR